MRTWCCALVIILSGHWRVTALTYGMEDWYSFVHDLRLRSKLSPLLLESYDKVLHSENNHMMFFFPETSIS